MTWEKVYIETSCGKWSQRQLCLFLGSPFPLVAVAMTMEGKGHLIWTEIKCPDSKGNIMSYHVCPKPSTNQVPIGRHKQLLRRINRIEVKSVSWSMDHQRNHDCHSHKHFTSHWEFMDSVGWPWLKIKVLTWKSSISNYLAVQLPTNNVSMQVNLTDSSLKPSRHHAVDVSHEKRPALLSTILLIV